MDRQQPAMTSQLRLSLRFPISGHSWFQNVASLSNPSSTPTTPNPAEAQPVSRRRGAFASSYLRTRDRLLRDIAHSGAANANKAFISLDRTSQLKSAPFSAESEAQSAECRSPRWMRREGA
jgi:hypothetical protein